MITVYVLLDYQNVTLILSLPSLEVTYKQSLKEANGSLICLRQMNWCLFSSHRLRMSLLFVGEPSPLCLWFFLNFTLSDLCLSCLVSGFPLFHLVTVCISLKYLIDSYMYFKKKMYFNIFFTYCQCHSQCQSSLPSPLYLGTQNLCSAASESHLTLYLFLQTIECILSI